MATTAPDQRGLAGENERLRAALEASERERAQLVMETERLRGAVAARTAERDEALEREAATADVLRVVAATPTDLEAVFGAICRSATRLCGATDAAVFRLEGDLVRNVFRFGEAQSRRRVGGAVPVSRTGPMVGNLEAFADQAVIAIENARLFSELQERLEEQTATGEVLRAISESPTDLRPVLDAIVENAMRVCEADDVVVFRVEGEEVERVAARGPVVAAGGLSDGRRPLRLAGSANACAILERRTVHVPDMLGPEGEAFWLSREAARRHGVRSYLAAPMLLGGEAVGLIQIRRQEVRPFSERQIRLLEGFASQAAIALENARLFAELRESNASLKEALEQQTATSEVLRAIASAPSDLGRVLSTVAEHAARLCQTDDALIWRRVGDALTAVAGYGPTGATRPGDETRPLTAGWLPARAALEGRTIHVPDLLGEAGAEYPVSRAFAESYGFRTVLAAPMLRDREVVGVIGIRRWEARPFTDRHAALLEGFASQAAIAIENARLFQELNESNRTLEGALEQQTATSDILRVIASNPSDLRSVFRTIGENAMRLCDAASAVVRLTNGVLVWPTVRVGAGYELHGGWGAQLTPPDWAVPLDHYHLDVVAARAILAGQTQHEPDLLADPELRDRMQVADGSGPRASLAAPLRRGEATVGSISVQRLTPGPFTAEQIAVLERFADQAVIAIENARLFAELESSNAALTEQKQQLSEALEQQTELGAVLRVMSQSPDDLQPVLDAIAVSAARLCEADDAQLFRIRGSERMSVAHHGAMSRTPPHRWMPIEQGWAPGMAARGRRTLHLPDLWTEARPEFALQRRIAELASYRTLLAVPLVRNDEAVGVFLLRRREAHPFDDQHIRLVETFADQAAIAMENTRLFSELRERDERRRIELERARGIQERLLPSSIEGWPGVLEIAHRFRPAVETSGDFYDVVSLAPSRAGAPPPLQIAVGDVAGKGMSAALVTALARSALRSSASMPTAAVTPSGTLRVAGQRLHEDVGAGHFVACALALVEPPGPLSANPRLKVANAAQVPVLLVREGETRELEAPGDRLPLGVRADGDYKDAEVELRAGDVVVLTSDGLVEAPSVAAAGVPAHLAAPEQAGELLGFSRLAASAAHWARRAESAEGVAAGMWGDLMGWCGEESHHDDVTLLVLRVPAR